MFPDKDNEHLRLLAIFHYVLAGITALFSLMPIIHVIMGIMILSGKFPPQNPHDDFPKEFFGWMFVIIGSAVIIVGLSLATGILLAGLSLSRKKYYIFCLVMAGIECLFMPFGTVLGVFTIIVLMRDSVRQIFQSSAGRLP
ncbi:MAG: hypothetical protein NTX50_03710 [Candidatus Sumerlaeota bacterium]|nr:hypothetical protein [Candidatus Sumerlaeota bacterium]